jgi:ribosomal protein S18 acetylase RimI-like enzyme
MATPERPRISLIFPNQYAEASAMLGRAFVDDPLFRTILPVVPDSQERARRMARLFDVVLRGQRSEGQPVLGVIHDGRIGAVAVVEYMTRPPSTASLVVHVLPTLFALAKTAGWSGVVRMIAALDTLSRNRPPEPHLYLNILGVEPALQRRHFGIAILDYLREQVALRNDLAGVYLETATEANLEYYRRAGYRVIGEIHPPGVRMWRMLQPREH